MAVGATTTISVGACSLRSGLSDRCDEKSSLMEARRCLEASAEAAAFAVCSGSAGAVEIGTDAARVRKSW